MTQRFDVRSLSLLLWLIATTLIIGGCGNSLEPRVGYQPPFLPITFTLDSAGNISVEGDASINTFLGEFSIGAELPLVSTDRLVVIFRNRREGIEQRYEVMTGRDVRVLTNGQTRIQVSADGTVVIDVTNGNIEDLMIGPRCTGALIVGCRATVYALDEGLKLRGGPGLGYPIVENLPRGVIVTLIGSPQSDGRYRWWNVQSLSGREGWSVEAADGLVTLVGIPE